MKQYKKHDRKRKYWFTNRVGETILQLSTVSKEIKIESESHAIALYLTQVEKNYSYDEIKVNPPRKRQHDTNPQKTTTA